MNNRERILRAVRHERVDRIPTDMWATPEVQEALMNALGITEGKDSSSPHIGLCGGPLSRGVAGIIALWDKLGVDGIFSIAPPYIGPEIPRLEKGRRNEWGFEYRTVNYGTGTYEEQVAYPLGNATSLADLDDHVWPDPDWYDYSKLPEIIDCCGARAVCVGYHAVFTYHNYLRGLEVSLMDPVMDPEFTQKLLEKLGSFFLEYHRRCFEAARGRIDFTQVTDDWGSQSGLITSPGIFREFYKPWMQRGIDLAKEYGVEVFHHDDGDCRPLLPELSEMGVRVLNPIQWRCGDWDLKDLKARYGSSFCFHSGVDNQQTLPRGTPDDVRSEVRMLVNTLASDGTGFILGPCHNLQPVTPVENILALYDEAKRICRKP